MIDQGKTKNQLMRELVEMRQKAEQRLRLLSSVVEQSSEGMAVSDLEGYLLFVNSAFAAMHGYTPQELVGKHLFIFHTPEQMPAVEAANWQIQETGEFSGEIWHVRRDGVVFPTLMHNSLLRNETGNPIGMVATLRNITERKQVEEALRESEERFRTLTESTSDWIWEVDVDGVYTYTSPKVKDLLGYEPEEVVGKTPFDLMPPEEAKRIAKEFRAIVKSQRPFARLENTNLHKDGRLVVLETSGVPFFNADGRLCGYRGIDRDITEGKQLEQWLRLLSSVVEQSREGMAVSDLEGYLLFVNSAFAAMHGYTPQELVGKHLSIFYMPEQMPAVEAAIRQIQETGEFSGESWHVRRDSVSFPSLVHNSLLRNGMGNPIGMIGTLRDITERKQAEEALRESEAISQLMLQTIPSGIFTIDLNRKITSWNRKAEEITGLKAEEVIGMECLRALDCDECKKECALFDDKVGKPIYGTACVMHVEGRDIVVSKNADILKDLKGNTIGGLESFVDITEHERLEHRLNKRVKELDCLYGISKVVERPGTTLDELYQEVANLLPPSWRYPEITSARITINGKEFKTTNFRETERKQSSDIKVEGAKVGVVEVCYLEDRPEIDEGPFLEEERLLVDAVAERLGRITERKKAEEALRESEASYKELADSIADVFFEMDGDLRYTYWNKASKKLTGISAKDAIGKSLYEVFPDTPQTRIAERAYLDVLRTQQPQSFVIEYQLGGKDYFFEISAYPSKRGLSVFIKDITERKQAEEVRVEHAAALARTEELQRSRRRIVTVQESLRRDIAKQLHGSVQNRLIVLLHRLTELEHATSPGELAAELGDLRQRLEELLESQVRPISYQLYPAILRQGLVPALQSLADQFESAMAIEMELDEELVSGERSDHKFILEPVRLAAYRIAEEALTNVVKHARASRVTIGLKLSSEGCLRLTVRDNGQGFDVGSTSGELGILMMQDYAEVMSGECVIRSAPGEGTEVTAILPRAGSGV